MTERIGIVEKLEKHLKEKVTSESQKIAIVGTGDCLCQLVSVCVLQGTEVFIFNNADCEGLDNSEKINCFPLNVHSLVKQSEHIKSSKCVIVLSCESEILEELLYIVNPFCSVIIIGPIEGVLQNFDFYSTVHYKNLELIFFPQN